jgi:hypothetical protein
VLGCHHRLGCKPYCYRDSRHPRGTASRPSSHSCPPHSIRESCIRRGRRLKSLPRGCGCFHPCFLECRSATRTALDLPATSVITISPSEIELQKFRGGISVTKYKNLLPLHQSGLTFALFFPIHVTVKPLPKFASHFLTVYFALQCIFSSAANPHARPPWRAVRVVAAFATAA